MVETMWFRIVPALAVVTAAGLVFFAGTMSLAVLLALGMVVLFAIRPSAGAYVYLVVTPLVAGITRDLFLPVLRIHEALLVMIVASLMLRGLVRMLAGHVYRFAPTPMDVAVIVIAVAGSLISMLWRVSQGESLTSDDFLYAIVFWKYLALYFVFRVAVKSRSEARTALWLALGTTGVVGAIAILQSLGLFGVPDLLFRWYPAFLGDTADTGRGSSTLGLTFAVADVALICIGATSVLVRDAVGRRRMALVSLIALFLLSAMAAGQFSGFIGIGVAVVALGSYFGEMKRVVRYGVPALVLGGLVMWPVLAGRLSGFQGGNGLPRSWNGRLENLTGFILPEFRNGWNLLFGVRPAARVVAPETWRDYVFIESGYVWLLWSGGIALLAAFVFFLVRGLRLARAASTDDRPEIRAIGAGVFVGLWVIAVLTVFDPHLTMRGVADLMFPLLAMLQMEREPSTDRGSEMSERVLVPV